MSSHHKSEIILRWAAPVLIVAIAGFPFFYRLAERELSSSHEARAAQNAQMVLSHGDWAIPRLFDSRVELQKPPLYYWLTALLALLQGGTVDAWSVRLPAALSALLCVIFVYAWARRVGRPRVGLLAALILATCLHFTWLARVGRVDMPLTLCVTVTLGGFFVGRQRRHDGNPAWRRWLVLSYLAIAAGVLCKGPIALALPGLTASVYLLLEWRRDRRVPSDDLRTLYWGAPLVLLVAAPWFVWANWQTDNRLWDVFVWHHNVERGLGGSLTHHPWWFYGPRVLVDLLPWSLLLPFAVYVTFKPRRASTGKDESVPRAAGSNACTNLERMGLVWFLSMLVFLSLMRFKRADYLLPAYPGFALWLGGLLDRWLDQVRANRTATRLRSATVAIVVGLCVAGWGYYLTWNTRGAGHTYRLFAEEIRRHTRGPVIFFRAEAHEVAFHVRRPLDTILEWKNLEVWANQAEPIYFVMPPECAVEWRRHLNKGELVQVLCTTDLPSGTPRRPLVLMRSVPAGREYFARRP